MVALGRVTRAWSIWSSFGEGVAKYECLCVIAIDWVKLIEGNERGQVNQSVSACDSTIYKARMEDIFQDIASALDSEKLRDDDGKSKQTHLDLQYSFKNPL